MDGNSEVDEVVVLEPLVILYGKNEGAVVGVDDGEDEAMLNIPRNIPSSSIL